MSDLRNVSFVQGRIPVGTSRYVLHGKATQTEYDGAGRPTKVTYTDGTFTQTVYDDFGRKTSQTDELNRTTNFEYDAYGRLTAVVQPLLSVPSVRPRTTYFYDAYGSLRAQTDALGHDTTFRYDAFQRQVKRSLPSDLKATGRAVANQNPSLLQASGNPGWPLNQWQGMVVRLVAGKGTGQIREVLSNTADTLTIAGTWDANQAPDGTTDFVVSKGPSATSVYATQARSTGNNTGTTLNDTTQRWATDQWLNRVVEIVAGPGTGQVRRITGNNASTLTLAGADWTTLPTVDSWYAIRRAERMAEPYATTTVEDPTQDWRPNEWVNREVAIVAGTGQGQRLTITANTATQLTVSGQWNPLPDSTSRYVIVGAVRGVGQKWYDVDLNGQRREFRYDEQGRVQLKELYDPAAADPAVHTQYHYDSLGRQDSVIQRDPNLPAAQQPQVQLDYQFDSENRVTRVTTQQRESAGMVSTVVNYGFDPVSGRRTSTWTPSSRWAYVYDTLGRLERVRVEQRNGQPVSEETVYVYTPVSTLSSVTRPTGVTTAYGYDLRHRVTAVTHQHATQPQPRYEYTRRDDGKISRVREFSGAAVDPQRTLDYVYDELGRLKEERHTPAGGSAEVTQYVLDLVGNRLQKVAPAGTTTWSYDARDRILDEVFAGVTTQYGWDANGALRCKSAQSNCQQPSATYEYDREGRLSRATVGQDVKSYRYNDHGLRIREEVTGQGAGITQFVVDESNPTGYAQVVEEHAWNAQQQQLVRKASFDYGLEPLSQWQNGTVSHYLMDAHSGVRALTDGSGAGADQNAYRYDAFGVQLTGPVGEVVNPLRYRGERFDAVAEQYYLRARTYAPSIGRFMAMDSFAGNLQDPMRSHKYFYGGGDPIQNADPSGLDFSVTGLLSTSGIQQLIHTGIGYINRLHRE